VTVFAGVPSIARQENLPGSAPAKTNGYPFGACRAVFVVRFVE
jgi:hypothetical protein